MCGLNDVQVIVATWIIGAGVILVNCYFVLDLAYEWFITSQSSLSTPFACTALGLIVIYALSLLYIALRPEAVQTFEVGAANLPLLESESQ